MKSALILTNKLNTILTEGIEMLLKKSEQYDNIYQLKYNELDDFVADITLSKPTIIYVFFPDKFETIYHKLRKVTNAKIVLLDDHKMYVNYNINELIKLHKVGIVNLHCVSNNLIECELALEDKNYYICSSTKDYIINDLINSQDQYSDFGFSKLERQILDLAKQGYNIQMTAKYMDLSKNTVAAYRSRMIKKADLKSFTELIFLRESNN